MTADKLNDLLLAALQRAGKPSTSGDLVDAATGLALAEGWNPEQAAKLTRKSVAKRLQHMEKAGDVRTEGSAFDTTLDRMTPTFVPVRGFNARAPVPTPPGEHAPTGKAGSYESMTRTQLIAVLDVQDEMLAEFARHLQEQERFFVRLGAIREKARARLLAVGLEAA